MNLGGLEPVALALGLGLLIGLEREWKESRIAGIRTFALIALAGSIIGLVVERGQVDGAGFLIGLGLVAVAILLWVGNQIKLAEGRSEPGVTTEVAGLVAYGCGVLAALGLSAEAIVIAGTTAVLLHWKGRLHGAVRRIGEAELRGIMRLVLIALVILPMLPDRTYGPFDILNPFRIWMLVVLIVGISLAAYLVHQLVDAEKSAVLGGILGGLISSTATTVSYARQTRAEPALAPFAALVVLIASSVVNLRIAFELGVAAPPLLRVAALPLAALLAVMVLLSLVQLLRTDFDREVELDHDSPTQLRAALVFGLLYAGILFTVAAVRAWLGEEALYGVAALSGLTDVDAITLSTAELHRAGRIGDGIAWRSIMIANLSNLVFKWGVLGVLGGRRLFRVAAAGLGLSILTGLAIVLFWPEAWLL